MQLSTFNFPGVATVKIAASFTKKLVMHFFAVALQPNASQGRLILEVSTSYTMTHHSQ